MDGDTTIMSDTTQDLLEDKNEAVPVDSFLLGERVNNNLPKQKTEEDVEEEEEIFFANKNITQSSQRSLWINRLEF